MNCGKERWGGGYMNDECATESTESDAGILSVSDETGDYGRLGDDVCGASFLSLQGTLTKEFTLGLRANQLSLT